jgi:hypothetical protein
MEGSGWYFQVSVLGVKKVVIVAKANVKISECLGLFARLSAFRISNMLVRYFRFQKHTGWLTIVRST